MGVRKICKPKGCRASPRCEHPWWFDVMHDGKRWRMRGGRLRAACAAPPSRSHRSRRPSACGSRSSWPRSWPDGDPRRARKATAPVKELTVAEFLDRYYADTSRPRA